MKNFQFESISLLSHRDKRARIETFSPRRNLLIGRNHTGKSSLIKTLFLTLGAKATGKLAQWDENTVSVVRFIANDQQYLALHQFGNRALFDARGNTILATGSYEEWSSSFSEITGFNLTLTNKDNESINADPKCFFLPFYINQDGSWQSGWNTFTGLQRYKAPNAAILEYFSGIKPPEYYAIQAEKKLFTTKLEELRREQRFLERAKERLSNKMNLNGPKLSDENFKIEIESLTKEVSALNEQQESMRNKLVKEKELQDNLNLQIKLAQDALRVHELDSKYLESDDSEVLSCPTCGAEHKESFMDYLTYAEDARILHDLVTRLRKDAEKVKIQYDKSNSELSDLNTRYAKISKILETRKGDLKFKDVVESAGSEKAFRAFEEEAKLFREEISSVLGDLDEIDGRMKELVDIKRSKEILHNFRDSYASARSKLNLPPVETKRLKLTSRPDMSGSGGPRSILAYYAALWKTCTDQTGSFLMPIVIDSPNQQAQDDINMPKVLRFIANDLPDNTQIIVGSETDSEFHFEKKFNFKVPYRLLEENQYLTAQAEIEPLMKKMNAALGG